MKNISNMTDVEIDALTPYDLRAYLRACGFIGLDVGRDALVRTLKNYRDEQKKSRSSDWLAALHRES